MKFREACCEMDFIIKHLNEEDANKIPKRVKEFFSVNKSPLYKVNINVEKELSGQLLLDETKAFINLVSRKYLQVTDCPGIQIDIYKEQCEQIGEKKMVVYRKNVISLWLSRIINFFKL